MRMLKIITLLASLMALMIFEGRALADRGNVTLDFGITKGATHSYPSNNVFYAIDDQPVFFKDGADLYFIKSSPSDSHGWHTKWKGTTLDDLQFDSVVTVHDMNAVWLGGSGWIDPATGTWHVVGVQEYKYDSSNNPKKTSGGGKTYFHRLWLFTSTDKGVNWYPQGEVISDSHPYDWDYYDRYQHQDWGPGPHTLFVDDRSGYFYLFFPVGWRDWTEDNRYVYGAAARCPISSKMAPGCWQKWFNGGWTEPGLGGKQSSIMPNGLNFQLAWNSYLNEYIAIGAWESEIGLADKDRHLWIATATDLATQDWTAPVFFNQNGTGWYFWLTDQTGSSVNNLGQNMRFYYGNQAKYQDITLNSAGTYSNYTIPQRLPNFVIPEPAWNGLTNSPDRTEGGTASDGGASNPAGQSETQAFDNAVDTSWLVNSSAGFAQYTFPGGNAYAVTRYTVTSGNGAAAKDPKNWTLQGSNDGTTWTAVDTRTGVTYSDRKQTLEFVLANSTAYKHYRLNVTANNGDPSLEVAEIQLFAGGTVFDTANPPSPLGRQIWLKSDMNGQYASAWSSANTPLEARAASVGTWEKLRLVDAGGGYAALQAYNGKYITVSGDPGNPLQATAAAIGTSEKFQLVYTTGGVESAGGYVGLLAAANGKYVTVSGDPGNPLQAAASSLGASEKFLLYWTPNLAWNKTVTASSTNNQEVPANAIDNSASTKASTTAANGDNAWLTIDLGTVKPVSEVMLNWGAVAYGKDYNIQASTDGVNWTTVKSITGNTSGGWKAHSFGGSAAAQYIRMQGVTRATTTYGYTILEFEIYQATDNLALNKTASASSSSGTEVPANAVDGNTSTKASTTAANGDAAWISVDLGAVKPVSDIKLVWGGVAYGKDYQLKVSTDGVTWSNVYTVTGNTSGGAKDHIMPGGTSARYIKMQGVTRASTTYGYTILEFEVY